ncbi:MAG: DHA2 family efflux MFS transporter permease subunit [Candidatus Moranbacteria bacterium]|nr:DHA2 family efflux MFS transporter permease subunit [Candidatus Moranbacteria bacterium]
MAAMTESDDSKSKIGRDRWMVLITVIVGTFLGRLDQTVVNLALPDIITDFKITVTSAGWIATAYILANAIFVPIWGKLGDTIGRKKVYLWGFGIFIFGSVLAGFAWNLSSMIIFRVIQAVAGSADYPTAMAILAVTFPDGKERAQALGIWSSSFAAAVVFGPLIGGPLIDNFGWRSVFLINLPIGIIGVIMALTYIHESVSEKKATHFDWWGAILLGISLGALVLVLDKGMSWGWLAWESLASYAISLLSLALFIAVEKNHPEPIVDFKFFKESVFTNTLVNNFIVFMAMMGSVFLIPIFAQTYLGYDATQTGYLFIPMAFAIVLVAPLGGSLTGKVQPRYVIALSTLVAAVGLYMFTGIDARSHATDIIIPMVVMALGIGFGMAQRTNIIATVVPPQEIGIASSILALARNIAGAFGIAVFGTILNNSTESKILEIARYSSLRAFDQTHLTQFTSLIILKAQIEAYRTVFFVASVIIFVGALLALMIIAKEEIEPGGEEILIMD